MGQFDNVDISRKNVMRRWLRNTREAIVEIMAESGLNSDATIAQVLDWIQNHKEFK